MIIERDIVNSHLDKQYSRNIVYKGVWELRRSVLVDIPFEDTVDRFTWRDDMLLYCTW